ncbi:MAG: hypothetical protein CL498_03960 [Actinobacteria bacterium]|nr:hypothetical protein [Actinomycetota bacterium]|tara:strand:+ start:12532 stop:12732 length:201 start_codon:yes stop_codon:yes gene_type:complete
MEEYKKAFEWALEEGLIYVGRAVTQYDNDIVVQSLERQLGKDFDRDLIIKIKKEFYGQDIALIRRS